MIFLLSFRRLLVVSLALTLWLLWLVLSDSQTKEQYQTTTGEILYIAPTYQDLPTRNHGKMRYLLLDSYPSVFEIFIGKDAGDFKPKYEKIDSLQPGDFITIYHKDKQTKSPNSTSTVNSTVQFIEKDRELFFEKGSSTRLMYVLLILISVGISVLGLILWKKGKIPY